MFCQFDNFWFNYGLVLALAKPCLWIQAYMFWSHHKGFFFFFKASMFSWM